MFKAFFNNLNIMKNEVTLKPLSLELSEYIKQHISDMEFIDDLIRKMPSMVGVPEKYLNN